jgi:hypothetical protein
MSKTPKRKEGDRENIPALHHDAPASKKKEDPPALRTDVPDSKVTVMIAACGLLLENELKRQKNSGIVEKFGQLVLDNVLLQPDKIYTLSRTVLVEKAITDGWIVDMGV